MLAAKDVNMREAARALFLFNTDEQVRKMCRDREEYYEDMQNYERVISERDDSIECYQKAIEKRDHIISEKDAQIQQLLAENEKLKAGNSL